MIDLHIHTTSSDGSDEPQDILIKAQRSGLKYISITDHDSIGAYAKLKKIRTDDYFKGTIIPGCEFTAVHEGKAIEVLGYGLDLDVIDSMGIISEEKFFDRENDYLKKLMSVCKSVGLSYDETLSIKDEKYFASQVMYADLKKNPGNEQHFSKDVWGSVNAFYRMCVTNEESPFFLNSIKDHPSVSEAADIIRKAGGKSFLAHLYVYYLDDHQTFLDSIVSLNSLDGIECYHSLHSMDQTRYLLEYCREHRLHASGGSDYHGKIKPTVKIGESLGGVRIPFEILEPWLPNDL